MLARLGFPDVTRLDLRLLLGVADGNLDRLLARLRMLVREERIFSDFSVLRDSVRQMYYVRE